MLVLDAERERLHAAAIAALGRLAVAGRMVPSAQWLLYGFVRKEVLTLALATGLLKTNKVTAQRSIHALEQAKVLNEITGKSRDRVYAYRKYLAVLSEDTGLLDPP
jgi:hypothetical protein